MTGKKHFEEGSLVLEFDETDRVLHWDRHAAHRRGVLLGAPGTKAVDFCLWTAEGAALLEITNYARYRLVKELAAEVAAKTRDTLASMTWACARGIAPEPWFEAFARRFIDCGFGCKLEVVLWLDADRPPDAVEANFIAHEIRARLRPWLFARVRVTNRLIQEDSARAVAWLRTASKNRRSA